MRFAHKWAFHQHGRGLTRRICDETQHVFKKIKKKKKERKSDIEQNIRVLLSKMDMRPPECEREATLQVSHKITTTKGTLAPHGFTEAKWVVASKSDYSYTKREVASVQGAQQ